MKISLCSSLLLPQAFLWLVLSCYCTGFLRCQGRKNKGIFVQHEVFHPGVLDSCLWGWHGAIPLLSTSSPEPLPMGGVALTLQELQSGLYQNSCGLPQKQKRILSSFCDGNEERAPRLACVGADCASLNMPCYCWGSNKVCYYSFFFVCPSRNLPLSISLSLSLFFFLPTIQEMFWKGESRDLSLEFLCTPET